MKLASGQEVRQPHRGGAPLLKVSGDGVLGTQDNRPDRLPIDVAVEAFVTRTLEVVTGPVASGLDEIAIADPVCPHEPSELRKELSLEGVLAAEALRLGDKTEDPSLVSTRQGRHVSKDTSICVWPQRSDAATL